MSTRRPGRRSITPAFDTLVDQWLATLVAHSTRAAYGHDLMVYVQWTVEAGHAPLTITTAEVEQFRSHCLTGGDGPATVNRRMAALSSFYRHVTAVLGSGANPVAGATRSSLSSKSETVHLDGDQADAVWRAALGLGDRTATVVGLVLLDGLKTNELLLLDIEHLDVRRGTITAHVPRRNRTEHIVLDARTAASLRRSLAGRAIGPLLLGENPTMRSARLTRFGVDYIIKRTGAKAGLRSPLTANILRSTHIVSAHASGVSMEDLQRSVGHASTRTTWRYIAD